MRAPEIDLWGDFLYKVLIVDDLEILRYDLKRMAIWGETTGFSIEGEAENGADALKKLKATPFDLVITDIRMPVMDGMDLLKAVSEEKLCPCIVLLSDYTEYSYAREGLLHGAFDYLGKPVDSKKLAELLSRVRVHLDNLRLEQAQLKQLKGLADEAFFPAQDVERVIGLLNEGDIRAVDVTGQMVEMVGAALRYDEPKSAIILKNAVESIFSRVVSEHEWISLYTNLSAIKQLNLTEGDWQTIKEKVKKAAEKLVLFLQKMIIWKSDAGIIKSACLQVLYHIEEGISVKYIAEKLYINKTYLSELFKQSTGVSLLEYITMVKVERAKFLLRSGTCKNYEIAERLGFNDHEYFSKIFKKHTGLSPNNYKTSGSIQDKPGSN